MVSVVRNSASRFILPKHGYQVCEKWLKDCKGRKLTLDDVEHYNKVVASLTRTRELMTQIDAVANGALWPKSI
jgi:hypothetical protein